jgi:isocitrate dehydrogenase
MRTARAFLAIRGGDVTDEAILELVQTVGREIRWTHIEKLHEFDGEPAFTKAQGED